MPGLRCSLAAVVLLVATFGLPWLPGATAQTATAMNWTDDTTRLLDTTLPLYFLEHMSAIAKVLPLTTEAASTGTVNGYAVNGTTDTISLGQGTIALISCDTSMYTGDLEAAYFVANAEVDQVDGILFYSEAADYCNWTDPTSGYVNLYTMKSQNDTRNLLARIIDFEDANRTPPALSILANATQPAGTGTTQTGSDSSATSAANINAGGPPPSTAVAMIILYSITGVITALFLIIIITGAVRAHRHPERYGPRNILGRPRQSRARGLARAILDGLPIVKFGEKEERKPGDVELASETREAADVPATTEPVTTTQTHTETAAKKAAPAGITVPAPTEEEGGIAAATAPVDNPDNQGCSICTEDFEIGQDQRVLPCDHRFHPACIDPWLLNVSGTCPLCRIDLRPPTSTTDPDHYDEDGNSILREDPDGMAPPLGLADGAGERERLSVRRSIMLSIIGVGQPARMSRQQRVAALREYRRQSARQEAHTGIERPVAVEEETSTRQRLRNAFRIRTRRTGQATDETSSTTQTSETLAPAGSGPLSRSG